MSDLSVDIWRNETFCLTYLNDWSKSFVSVTDSTEKVRYWVFEHSLLRIEFSQLEHEFLQGFHLEWDETSKVRSPT
jgi:hypothetical protein